MSIEAVVYGALASLVGGRMHANVFPQVPAVPITPAILVTYASNAVTQDICGAGTDEEADTRVQIDVYSTTFDGARAIRLQVMAAMEALTPPMVWQGDNSVPPYDPDLKLHRCSLDFIQYPSSA
ncbi:MAG TPA: DUF3168 domain-containing protein [Variovorax sp.]|nr:DUF3168 domain-containing protein [Variovorax sp.]